MSACFSRARRWRAGAHTQAAKGVRLAGTAQTLVDGTASDPSAVVMQVERAQLAMQLASQIRTKAVEAYQTIFQTQV